MESALVGLSQSFRGQAAGITTFSEELAHLIMAGADYLLVPSRFEPCGLVAQCAARYGAVPIVAAVGGLKDLVTPEVSRWMSHGSRLHGGRSWQRAGAALQSSARLFLFLSPRDT